MVRLAPRPPIRNIPEQSLVPAVRDLVIDVGRRLDSPIRRTINAQRVLGKECL